MKPAASLRARVLAGAVAWSIGLFILASVALGVVMSMHPGAPATVHRWLEGPLPVLFGVACLIIGVLQVRSGLSGIAQIRRQLAALHEGREDRLEGSYPAEIQPLADDLNTLLDRRDATVEQALAKAADLAHGLKTPLAILAHEADRAAKDGQPEIARSVHQQIDRMRRQVDYHLAHTRAMSGQASGARCGVRDSVDGLVRALERLHAERGLHVDVRIDPACSVRGLAQDIEEMLGNLLDNACKWARTTVRVEAEGDGSFILVTVDDDGPGLPPELWEQVLHRGVRADEAGTGSGLGLAIVHSLAGLYGGSIALSRSPLGGLRAALRLPA